MKNSKLDLLPTVEVPYYIDNTILSTFKLCPRKAYYQYLRHLKPVGEGRSVHLIAGGALAAGLEEVRKKVWGEQMELPDALYYGWLAILKHWGDFPAEPVNSPKTLANTLAALEYYFEVFPPKTDPIQPLILANGSPAVEFSFTHPTGFHNPQGQEILYTGRFDMFGVRKIGHQAVTYIVDEKTTTKLGKSWRGKWPLASQFTGYAWAARELGYDVSGVCVRGISYLSNSFGHEESLSQRTESDIERWKASTAWFMTQYLECARTNTWPQNFSDSCQGFSGCPYQNLCLSDNPERWIDSQFEVQVWNPLTHSEGND